MRGRARASPLAGGAGGVDFLLPSLAPTPAAAVADGFFSLPPPFLLRFTTSTQVEDDLLVLFDRSPVLIARFVVDPSALATSERGGGEGIHNSRPLWRRCGLWMVHIRTGVAVSGCVDVGKDG